MIERKVTINELSEYLGISGRRIQQLSKAGIIPKDSRGEYELFCCLKAYFRYLRKLIKRYSKLYRIEVERAGRRTRFENLACFEDMTADVPKLISLADKASQKIQMSEGKWSY